MNLTSGMTDPRVPALIKEALQGNITPQEIASKRAIPMGTKGPTSMPALRSVQQGVPVGDISALKNPVRPLNPSIPNLPAVQKVYPV
jgi:hypothetical protein